VYLQATVGRAMAGPVGSTHRGCPAVVAARIIIGRPWPWLRAGSPTRVAAHGAGPAAHEARRRRPTRGRHAAASPPRRPPPLACAPRHAGQAAASWLTQCGDQRAHPSYVCTHATTPRTDTLIQRIWESRIVNAVKLHVNQWRDHSVRGLTLM